ncbi:hypothetical protein [Hallella colorans]|uniref:hypothetical protein n=1 Tax=Hallella colorans TaxID=1703337 RepID=UPI0023F14C04|nr:hypothetical protein [Hallella colorans]
MLCLENFYITTSAWRNAIAALSAPSRIPHARQVEAERQMVLATEKATRSVDGGTTK